MKRQFSTMAYRSTELLSFSIVDFNRMKSEFLDAYEIIFQDSFQLLYRALKVKLNAIKELEAID